MKNVNPFLFIRGLSCPSCIHVVTLAILKKILGPILAWKSGLKVPFSAFRALLPSGNYSAE
jgi:hypothetical protein